MSQSVLVFFGLGFIFCLSYVIFSFTLAKTFSFHGLKLEVVYLILIVIGSTYVSREVVISISSLEKFIVRDSL